MRRAVAIDFDLTLADTDFPTILSPIPEAIQFVKECNRNNVAVILWTCRTDIHLTEAVEWCFEQGITLNAVNCNLIERVKAYHEFQPNVNPDGRKVNADLYIDDKALGGVDWNKAFEWLRS